MPSLAPRPLYARSGTLAHETGMIDQETHVGEALCDDPMSLHWLCS